MKTTFLLPILLFSLTAVVQVYACEEEGNCPIRCEGHLIDYDTAPYKNMSVSQYAGQKAKIHSLVHGASVSRVLKIAASGKVISAEDAQTQDGKGQWGNAEPLKSIFVQAMPDIQSVKNYGYSKTVECPEDPNERTKIPQCAADPDLGGFFEEVLFEVSLLFELKVLDDMPFYANQGWNYDDYFECISAKKDDQIKSLRYLTATFKNDDIRNEITFYQPGTGLPLKRYLKGIYVQPKNEANQKAGIDAIIAEISSALASSGWSENEIAELFRIP